MTKKKKDTPLISGDSLDDIFPPGKDDTNDGMVSEDSFWFDHFQVSDEETEPVDMETQAANGASNSSSWSLVENTDNEAPTMNGMQHQLGHAAAPQQPVFDAPSSTGAQQHCDKTDIHFLMQEPLVPLTDDSSVDYFLSDRKEIAHVWTDRWGAVRTFTDDQVEQMRAVCFAKPTHQDNKLWRLRIKTFSKNIIRYPSWSDNMAEQIKQQLEQDGVNEYFVRVEVGQKKHGKKAREPSASNINNDTKEGTKGEKEKQPTLWRKATDQEFFSRTKQRFHDDRKKPPAKGAKGGSKHRPECTAEPVTSEAEADQASLDNSAAAARRAEPTRLPSFLSVREHWFTVPERSVCIGWKRHPGTMKWSEVVKNFSDDKTNNPEWRDAIVDQVIAKLATEHYRQFLVFRNDNDQPTTSIDDGIWVQATPPEIRDATWYEFTKNRNQLKDPTISNSEAWTGPQPPPGRGGQEGHSERDSNKSAYNWHQEESGPTGGTPPPGNTSSGGGGRQHNCDSSHMQRCQMDLDDVSDDDAFSSEDDVTADDYSDEEHSGPSDDHTSTSEDDDSDDEDGADDDHGDCADQQEDKGLPTNRSQHITPSHVYGALSYRDRQVFSSFESDSSCSSSDGFDSESTINSQKRRKLDVLQSVADDGVQMDLDRPHQDKRVMEEGKKTGELTKQTLDEKVVSRLSDKVVHIHVSDRHTPSISFPNPSNRLGKRHLVTSESVQTTTAAVITPPYPPKRFVTFESSEQRRYSL